MRSKLAWLVAVLATAVLGIVPSAIPAQADALPLTNWSPVTIGADVPGAATVVTDPSGGVTVGCASQAGASRFVSFSAAGVSSQRQNEGSFCTGTSTVGADGTVYVYVNAGSSQLVRAWRGNSLIWEYTIPCGPYGAPRSMAMGANGNLYMTVYQGSGSCSGQQLVGVSPQSQTVLNQAIPGGNVLPLGLSAYNSGLVLYQSDGLRYVSYSGKFASAIAPANTLTYYAGSTDQWFEASPSGRVFVATRANAAQSLGCANTNDAAVSISAVDPGKVAWTTPQLDACTYVREIHATPSGGAVARLLTIPAIGSQTTEKIVLFGATGQTLWSKSLPQVDAPGGRAISADLNGNIAVRTNQATWQTVNGSSYRFPEIGLELLSGSTGGSLSSATLRGDSTTTAGPSYMWGNSGSLAIANNTAYVAAYQCTTLDHCDASTTRLYALSVPGLAMDYPRGAILGQKPTTPQVRNYVALGDSYSSGEGVEPFENGTDTPSDKDNYNACHRSASSYARLLAADASLNLKVQRFIACSGAKTPQITGPWPQKGPNNKDGRNLNEPAQASESVLKPTTDIVTLTIGGNDADFGGLATRCLWLDCTSYRQQYMAKVAALDSKLQAAYRAILKQAPNAKLYVIGYPQLLSSRQQCTSTNAGMGALDELLQAAKSKDPFIGELARQKIVALARDGGLSEAEIKKIKGRVEFNRSEQTLMRDFASGIDARVQAMVRRVSLTNPGRITYIDPLGPKSPFTGHELCTVNSHFNGVDVVHPAYSFHPNAAGAADYKQLIAPYLTAKS